MTATIITALRDQFHATCMEQVLKNLRDNDDFLDESILTQLETIAERGTHQAQVCLAHLYMGSHAFVGDAWDGVLDEPLQNPAKGRYWALVASTGEGYNAAFSRPDFMPCALAEVLLQVNDDECKLRALSVLVRATADKESGQSALCVLEDHFAGFDLEAFLVSYKPPEKQTEPASPQQALF